MHCFLYNEHPEHTYNVNNTASLKVFDLVGFNVILNRHCIVLELFGRKVMHVEDFSYSDETNKHNFMLTNSG